MNTDLGRQMGALTRSAAGDANKTPLPVLTFLHCPYEEIPSDLDMMPTHGSAGVPVFARDVKNEYRFAYQRSSAVVSLMGANLTRANTYDDAGLAAGWVNFYRAATRVVAIDFGRSMADLLPSDLEARAASTTVAVSKATSSLQVTDIAWSRVANWNDAARLMARATESRSRPVAGDFWTSLEAEAARWSRRIEDVAASVRQELEKMLLPLPPRQLATGALHTRGDVIRARGTQLAGEVRDDVDARPRRLAIRLIGGPRLRGGRVTLAATVDRALAGKVARVVLVAGDYEVTLAEVPVEADASGGLIRIDCPLGDLGLGATDGGLPASLFRVVIGQEPATDTSSEARGE